MKTWQCVVCGFIYDEAKGIPKDGIPAGTRWEDIPADWSCPDCGVELNQHAAKLVDPVNAREAAQMDPELGALIQEAHCCPECGKGASRRSR